MANMFNEDFIKQIHKCDTLFTNIDTIGDNVIHIEEFEAYVKKYNPEQADYDSIMEEFDSIALNTDNVIYFDEFLRATCEKANIYMKPELDSYDLLRIHEIVEYRHLSHQHWKGMIL